VVGGLVQWVYRCGEGDSAGKKGTMMGKKRKMT
jgi:hypothetical protein